MNNYKPMLITVHDAATHVVHYTNSNMYTITYNLWRIIDVSSTRA